MLISAQASCQFLVDFDLVWQSYNQAGMEAYQQGNYAEAQKQLLDALQEAENFGPEDPRLAVSLANLADLYRDQGKYAVAEPFCLRALAIREKVLGPEHPDVAASLNNLTALYRDQGKYAEAEPLYQRSLAIAEKALGPEHPNVALVLASYADLLHQMNREAEASKMEARAQAIRAKQSEQDRAQ